MSNVPVMTNTQVCVGLAVNSMKLILNNVENTICSEGMFNRTPLSNAVPAGESKENGLGDSGYRNYSHESKDAQKTQKIKISHEMREKRNDKYLTRSQ